MKVGKNPAVYATKEIAIQAPVEEVWRILTDVENWPRWHSDIKQAKLEEPLGEGAQFLWSSGGMKIRSQVTEMKASEVLQWTGLAIGTSARHSWQLTHQNGMTLVTTTESMDGWLVRLLQPLIQRTLSSSLEAWLKALKRRAEEAKISPN